MTFRGANRVLALGAGTLGVVAAIVSCVDLDSLGAGGARPPDAGDEAGGDAAPSGPDPCEHIAPPPRAGGSAPGEDLPDFELALGRMELDPVAVPGFDLDGVCTCDPRPGSARAGASSCARPTTAPADCDLDGGADNALARLEKENLPTSTVTNTANTTIRLGRGTALFTIGKYNGLADDDEVVVGALVSLGLREKGCPDSGLTEDGGTWTPGNCGQDTWLVSSDSFIQSGSQRRFPLVVTTGYVRNFQLVARFDNDVIRLPFNDASDFSLAAPVLSVKLVPLAADLTPRDPSRPPTTAEQRLWRGDDGVLAGRITAEDALEVIGGAEVAGGRLCTTPAFDGVRSLFCTSLDISASPTRPASAACDALSGAARITLVPARAGDAGAPRAPFTGCDSARAKGLLRCTP